jgi:uncharacterized repeat protein (TIGR04076 family)
VKYDVRITVLDKLFHKDIIEQFAPSPDSWTPCDKFSVGQSFVLAGEAPWDKPSGFCGWAWADIQKMAWGMSRGGPDRFVTCCTDGYRPVIFLLERLDPES